MLLNEFFTGIGLPEWARGPIAAAADALSAQDMRPVYALLLNEATGDEGLKALAQAVGEDKDGIKTLAAMSVCALSSYERYRVMGIPDEIFDATMQFVSRFLQAEYERSGRLRFIWGWWFPRQLSLREFRLGALEYEMTRENEAPCIRIHIPAGTDMSLPSLNASLQQARAFFARYFPAHAEAEIFCDSWMLSPVLKELLPERSHILLFQRNFTVLKTEENDAALEWIFPDKTIPTKALPENTSLQKKVKRLLLAGGHIGWTLGKLNADAFCERPQKK